jgi:hypothetical protein
MMYMIHTAYQLHYYRRIQDRYIAMFAMINFTQSAVLSTNEPHSKAQFKAHYITIPQACIEQGLDVV